MCPLQARLMGGDDVTDSVSLLISILVRYPEVAAINFDPWKQILRFNFICKKVIGWKDFHRFKKYAIDSIMSFNYLERKEAKIIEINCQAYEDLTIIEVKRDVSTLVQDEIALIVQVIHQFWEGCLISDLNDTFIEEDLLVQEELIEYMLQSVKGSGEDKYLYAFREEGKVLVFNK